jgi:hypothetical protein
MEGGISTVKGLSKGQSIILLQSNGLNTPQCRVFNKPFDWDDMYHAVDGFDERVSIRTWRKGDFNCPFFPNLTKPEAKVMVKEIYHTSGELLDEIIMSEGINPQESMRCGRIMDMSLQGSRAFIEYFEGPGTVRELDSLHPNKVFREQINGTQETPMWMSTLIRRCYPMFKQFPGCTLEWSHYNQPIGRLQERFIFWEVL